MATLNRTLKAARMATLMRTTPVIPLANRTTPRHRNYISASFATLLKTSTTTISRTNNATNQLRQVFPTHRYFAALSDKRSNAGGSFLSVIDSAIDNVEEKLHKVAVEVPEEFPFKIVDNPGERFITLTREYQGGDEEMKVKVHWPHFDPYCIELDVCVSKKGGPTLAFSVAAGTTDDIRIKDVAVRNPNVSPYLDENLQKHLCTYLESRGFEPSLFRFLYDYMVQKKRRKYIEWLKNLKNYIADFNSRSTNNLSRQVSRATSIPTHIGPSALAETPGEFPFKIEDNAMEPTITLTREYQGEKIKVTVHKPPHDLSSDDVELIGSISTTSGLILKFNVATLANGIRINSFNVKNLNASADEDIAHQRPVFLDLDEDVQKACRTYLEARGIEPSIVKFLYEYMVQIQRKHLKHAGWLKSLKKPTKFHYLDDWFGKLQNIFRGI